MTSKQDQDAGVGPEQNNNQSKDQSKDDTIAAQQDQKQAGPEAQAPGQQGQRPLGPV